MVSNRRDGPRNALRAAAVLSMTRPGGRRDVDGARPQSHRSLVKVQIQSSKFKVQRAAQRLSPLTHDAPSISCRSELVEAVGSFGSDVETEGNAQNGLQNG